MLRLPQSAQALIHCVVADASSADCHGATPSRLPMTCSHCHVASCGVAAHAVTMARSPHRSPDPPRLPLLAHSLRPQNRVGYVCVFSSHGPHHCAASCVASCQLLLLLVLMMVGGLHCWRCLVVGAPLLPPWPHVQQMRGHSAHHYHSPFPVQHQHTHAVKKVCAHTCNIRTQAAIAVPQVEAEKAVAVWTHHQTRCSVLLKLEIRLFACL